MHDFTKVRGIYPKYLYRCSDQLKLSETYKGTLLKLRLYNGGTQEELVSAPEILIHLVLYAYCR